MPHIYQDAVKALQETLKVRDSKRALIVMDNKYDFTFKCQDLKEAIPDHDFVSFRDKVALKKWLESSNDSHHLVLELPGWNTEVSGMEFKSMILLSSVCLKCNFEYRDSRILTRAKASLVIARYQNETCDCTHSWGSNVDPRFRFKVEQKMLERKI